MKHSFFSLLFISFSIIAFSQTRSEDEKAINAQMDAMIASWNHHDFTDMKNYTTDDIDFVNPVGMWWKGRAQMQYALQTYHKGMFKNVDNKKISTKVRFITPEVAIVHLLHHTGKFTSPDNKVYGDNDNLGTYLFVKKTGRWLMTAGEEVAIDPIAAQHNPVNEMAKQ